MHDGSIVHRHGLRTRRNRFDKLRARQKRRRQKSPLPHIDEKRFRKKERTRLETDTSAKRPSALPKAQTLYLWKKNFMHQQNTGTSRMTT